MKIKYCECGCGAKVNNRFIRGHSNLVLRKGKTFEEIFGKERANKLMISKQQIIDKARTVFNEYGSLTKVEFMKYIWNHETIRYKFGSMDKFAKRAGIEFKKTLHFGRLGNNESLILDKIEKEKNIKIERQKFINGVFVDGYDEKNNTVYEVDEKYHRYTKVQDAIKEEKIKVSLDCNIIRIDEKNFLDSKLITKFIYLI